MEIETLELRRPAFTLMPPDEKQDLQLELGHVLFIDIVGYSRMLINEQHDALHELNRIVRNTEAFRAEEAAGKLIRLPSGDGMALVFSSSPAAPVQCALEISKALKNRPELPVRMGVNSGPVSGVVDVNDKTNVAGTGINLAQRVMDCGDAGHILLSKRVAEDLAEYRQWQSQLHDLGECKVKHEVVVSVVNLYNDELGNPALPGKFKAAQQATPSTAERAVAPPLRGNKRAWVMGALALLLVVAAAAFWIFSQKATPPATNVAAADSSVAPPPTEKPGRQREHLRGRTGAAVELYGRAKSLLSTTAFSAQAKQNLLQAVDLLNQTVARNPKYFFAYCQLAYAHDELYSRGFDHTAERKALGAAAMQAALALRPETGLAHFTRAEHLYRGDLDDNGALAELESARRTMANDPRVFELTGYIRRRQGQQPEALHHLQHAAELDPRNVFVLQQLAISYGHARRYADEIATLDRALLINPNDPDTKAARGLVELDWKADPRTLHQTIESIRAENPNAVASIANTWLTCALAEHDAQAAEAARVALGEGVFGKDAIVFNPEVSEGLIARMENDPAKAQAAFAAARVQQEKLVQAQPDYGPAECVLGLIDAGLGRKEEAQREGRRAAELLPVVKDAINGAHIIEYLAMIDAWVGDKNLACDQLAIATRGPGALSYGELKLLPYWDSLRGDPRFEKIVADLAPRAAAR